MKKSLYETRTKVVSDWEECEDYLLEVDNKFSASSEKDSIKKRILHIAEVL